MSFQVTDKRKIGKTSEPVVVLESESKVKIAAETLRRCQSEAIRGWLFSVMPDQSEQAPNA